MSCPIYVYDLNDADADSCETLIDKKGWVKVLINLLFVLVYQYLRTWDEDGTSIEQRSWSSYWFIAAATMWLSGLDLRLACLRIWPGLLDVYDIVAISVLANLALNYIWSEVLLFINTIIYLLYIYSEDSKIGEFMQWIFDKDDGYFCLSDVLSLGFLLWVTIGLGIPQSVTCCLKGILSKTESQCDPCLQEDLDKCFLKCRHARGSKTTKKKC